MTVLCPGGGYYMITSLQPEPIMIMIHAVTELLYKDNLPLHIPLFRDFIILNQTVVCWLANYINFLCFDQLERIDVLFNNSDERLLRGL